MAIRTVISTDFGICVVSFSSMLDSDADVDLDDDFGGDVICCELESAFVIIFVGPGP